MTRDQAAKWISAIQGFIDGKDIQYKDLSTDEWKDVRDPGWFNTQFIGEYRIKPEVVKVAKWACYWIEGGLVACTFDTELCAKEAAIQNNGNNSGTYIAIKLEGTYER